MDSSDYIYILNKPNAISEQHGLFLDKIIEKFPYLQSAMALRLKKLYNQNSYIYNQELKKTACFTTDRGVLFELITSKNFVSIQQDFFDTKERQLKNSRVTENKDAVTDTVVYPVAEVTEPVVIRDEVVKTPFSTEEYHTTTENVAEEAEDNSSSANINNNEHVVMPQTNTVEQATENSVDIQTEKEVPAIAFLNELTEENNPEEISIEETIIIQEQIPETNPGAESISKKESMPEKISSIVDSFHNTNTYDIVFVPKNDTTESSIIIQEAVDPVGVSFNNTKDSIIDENKITEPSAEVAAIKDKLQIGKPLDFSKEEKHSFQEWLQLSSFTLIDRSQEQQHQDNEKEAELERQKKLAIIDKFIETNPKIPPVKNNITVLKVNEEPTPDHSMLMTETLAKVYLEQKKYLKAIQAYEILILKYPEKSSFFADRISDIKILQKNNF